MAKKSKQPAKNYKLPSKRSVRANSLAEHSILLYGREKIGKTTLAAQFPDAIFLMFEPGGKDLEIFQAPINTWQDFLGYLKLLKDEPDRFETIIIDTVDLCYKMAEDYACSKLAISHPSEEEWGKGWAAVKNEFRSAMLQLQNSGRGLILISHEDEREYKTRKGGTSHRIAPSFPKGARQVLEPMVDLFVYYDYDDEKRRLWIRGDDQITAGCRLSSHFVGVNKIEAGGSPKETYQAFIAAYETTESGTTAPKKVVKKKKVIKKKR